MVLSCNYPVIKTVITGKPHRPAGTCTLPPASTSRGKATSWWEGAWRGGQKEWTWVVGKDKQIKTANS